MKNYLKHLQSLVTVALCVIMVVSLSNCSKDDDEPAKDNLSSIIVGVWAQDGDDDIMVINSNGTGMFYESPEDYDKNEVSEDFTWTLKGEWLTFDWGYTDLQKLRIKDLVSKDKIIWYDYWEQHEFSKDDPEDSFGHYRIWTWERYPF